MATFDLEKAQKDAIASIQDIETQRLKLFKVAIRHDTLANKPEDEDDLFDEDGKPNGPQNLAEELQVKKIFKCLICKNIPIAPVKQCTNCESMYCSQCLDEYMAAIDRQRIENQKKAQKEAEGAEALEMAMAEVFLPQMEKIPEKVEEAPKVEDEVPVVELACLETDKRARRRRNRGAAKVPIIPDVMCCFNKKCKAASFKTQPLGRIIRNIMCSFEFEYEGETLTYENLIKQQKEDFKEMQVYKDPFGSDVEMKKDELKDYLVNESPNFQLKCMQCSYKYKRCDFFNNETHNCIKNLLEQITNANKKIEDLKAASQDEAKANNERQKKIDELEAEVKKLNDEYNKLQKERSKLENMNYDLFSARYTYNNHARMKLKLPRNFVNTLENSKEGKILDGPIFVNNQREKKGASWQTTKNVDLVFKRKIAFNAYSMQFWQGEPPKLEEEKVEEVPVKKEDGEADAEGEIKEKAELAVAPAEEPVNVEVEEHRPGNRAYMYIYMYDVRKDQNGIEREHQISYQHFSNVPKEQKPVDQHAIKWRDGNSIITDHVRMRFMVYNDDQREQFEKLMVTDFNFYY